MGTKALEIPENIYSLFECNNESDEFRRNAMLLYPFIANETISHGKAAELLGVTKWELIDFYGDEGFPYIDLTQEEAENDADNVRHILEGVLE